jgi:hypothetical protein
MKSLSQIARDEAELRARRPKVARDPATLRSIADEMDRAARRCHRHYESLLSFANEADAEDIAANRRAVAVAYGAEERWYQALAKRFRIRAARSESSVMHEARRR